MQHSPNKLAFTLIELSIVLVIIGLIVGGILVGRDLINASAVRAQIQQIEQFNTSARAFYGKYNYLPGDIPDPYATNFGFKPRGTLLGQGDGNGTLEGINGSNQNFGIALDNGETVLFWVDLSQANLINYIFSKATAAVTISSISSTNLSNYFPKALINSGNYIYAYSRFSSYLNVSNDNVFGLAAVSGVSTVNSCGDCMQSTPGLSVHQAYSIDKKIDDGLPQSGKTTAIYNDANTFSSLGIGYAPNAATASPSTCFDTTSKNYSISQNNGAGINCALSFKFQ